MSKNRKLIIAVSVLFLFAVTLAIVLAVRSHTNKSSLDISNLDSCAKNINKGVAANINANMYTFIKYADTYNHVKSLPKYDSTLRANSCSTTTKDGVHTTTAILDIPAAEQSWKITFHWVDKKGSTTADLNTVTPTCLPVKQLPYGDFNCEKIMNLYNYGTVNYDPILKVTPYYGDSFDLIYNPATKVLSVTIREYSWDMDNTAMIQNDEAAVPIWLTQHGLNPADYTIEYYVREKSV